MASERFSQKLGPDFGPAGSAFGVGPVSFVAGLGADFGFAAPVVPACFGLGFGSDLKDGENGGGACV